jgi:hypothetical protein
VSQPIYPTRRRLAVATLVALALWVLAALAVHHLMNGGP